MNNKIDLTGLYNQPLKWLVYEFFYQQGGCIGATPMGLRGAFLEKSDADKFADERTTPRNYFRVVNQDDVIASQGT